MGCAMNCQKCDHFNAIVDDKPVEGYCYMFEKEPEGECSQFTNEEIKAVQGNVNVRLNIDRYKI